MEELTKKLDEQRMLLERVFVSVERTRKYFLWTLIISAAFIVLPLIAMLFVVPRVIGTYMSEFSSLGGF